MTNNQEEFYRRLSGVYDQLFPVEADTLEFLRRSGARPGRTVLDLACGSGLYTESLIAEGVDAYGLDASPDLIELAKKRSAEPGRFMVADMRDIGCLVRSGPDAPPPGLPPGKEPRGTDPRGNEPPGSFDLVFCIGNSLAHLGSLAEVRTVVDGIAGSLTDGRGTAVVQYVDMQDFPVGGARELPSLHAENTIFERSYLRTSPDHIIFNAVLVDAASGVRDELQNELLVLRTEDLTNWFSSGGLSVEIRGGFGGQPLEGSWVRVLCASTPRRDADTAL